MLINSVERCHVHTFEDALEGLPSLARIQEGYIDLLNYEIVPDFVPIAKFLMSNYIHELYPIRINVINQPCSLNPLFTEYYLARIQKGYFYSINELIPELVYWFLDCPLPKSFIFFLLIPWIVWWCSTFENVRLGLKFSGCLYTGYRLLNELFPIQIHLLYNLHPDKFRCVEFCIRSPFLITTIT